MTKRQSDPVIQQARQSVQSEVKPSANENLAGTGLWFWMQSGGLISPWWSTTRDAQLRTFAKASDHFQGAMWMISTKLTSVPFRIEPRDPSIKLHHKQADDFQMMLTELTQFGNGWQELWMRFWYDAWTQDNGAFMEVLGGGRADKAIRGPVFGLAHLDAARCTRTSNPVYPVQYDDPRAGRFRFHHTRVIFTSQQPSTSAQMNGVGHSWLTRSYNATQNLVDIATYKEEKLGSRPPRQMLLGKGIDTAVLMTALKMAANRMDNEQLKRFAKTVVVGSVDPNFDVEVLDLASVPDGFDERVSVELGMFLIALAGGFPPRWLWPATTSGATRADAIYSHISGSGGGAAWHIGKMQTSIGGSQRGAKHAAGKVLPPHLKIVFDYQDDEQDRQQADIKKTRSDQRGVDLDKGVTDIRVSRQQAVSDGDLSEDQFAYLELKDGRLPDGSEVLTLFESPDETIAELLDLGTDESPLLVAAHEPAEMLLAIDLAAIEVAARLHKATNRTERRKVEQAAEALGKLKGIYEPLIVEQIMTEEAAEAGDMSLAPVAGPETPEDETPKGENQPGKGGGQSPDGDAEGESEESAKEADANEAKAKNRKLFEKEQTEKSLVAAAILKEAYPDLSDDVLVDVLQKQFNFGARVGEVIRGALARGRGGRFMNAAQLEAGRMDMLRKILGKIRGKLGAQGGGSAAEAKKVANRQAVDAALSERGAPAGTLGALNAMRAGDTPDAATTQKLIDAGLAKRNDDGTVNMTAQGRKLRAAGDSGDVDAATAALQKKPPKAKKPKKAPKGAKPKKTPEQLEAAKLAKAEAKRKADGVKRAGARDEAFDRVGQETGIDPADLTDLTRHAGKDVFGSDGAELGALESLPTDVANRLAQNGLVKFDTAGNAIVTPAGRALVSGAEKGDTSKVAAAVSSARDAVVRQRERIDVATERATDQRDKADGYRTDMVSEERAASEDVGRLETEAGELADDIANMESSLADIDNTPANQSAIARIKGQIKNAKERAQAVKDKVAERKADLVDDLKKLQDKADKADKRADDYDTDADELASEFGIDQKSVGNFAGAIRSAVRGLWTGSLDEFGFVDTFLSALNRNLTQAWHEGAAQCGIAPDELTQKEKDALNRFINEQILFAPGFAEDVAVVRDIHADDPRDPAGKLGPLMGRAELWIGRYETAKQMGQIMACANKKMEWILGEAEHCSSCVRLAGKVKRANFWNDRGIIPAVPGAPYLECKGFNCACQLVQTDKPLSKGPLPGLP